MNADVYARMASLQTEHWWFRARRDVLDRVLSSMALPDGAQILEIGTGTGGNLALLSRYGEVTGLEGNAFAREHASSVSGVQVVDGSLPDAVPFEDSSFDLVCLLDVLEHIDDDEGALRRVARLVRPGGRVLATVPAYAWLWSAHDDAHHHKRRYTLPRLKAVGREAGLTAVRGGYYNALLLPPVAAVRLFGRLLGQRGSSDDVLPGRVVNGCLYRVFSAERLLLGRGAFPFGVSVFAIFEMGADGA